jgi:energy-converting hydrogenase Eha subunit G
MHISEKIAGSIFELAIGHGLVDDLLRQHLAKSEAFDLINRLLMSDAIDVTQAVMLINAVAADASGKA